MKGRGRVCEWRNVKWVVDSNRCNMTAINKTRFGIYGGQFVSEAPMDRYASQKVNSRSGDGRWK